MSINSKQGGGSRNSDEDGKPAVSVKVGRFSLDDCFLLETQAVDVVTNLDMRLQPCVYVRRCNPQIQDSSSFLSDSNGLWSTTYPQQA